MNSGHLYTAMTENAHSARRVGMFLMYSCWKLPPVNSFPQFNTPTSFCGMKMEPQDGGQCAADSAWRTLLDRIGKWSCLIKCYRDMFSKRKILNPTPVY